MQKKKVSMLVGLRVCSVAIAVFIPGSDAVRQSGYGRKAENGDGVADFRVLSRVCRSQGCDCCRQQGVSSCRC